MGTIEYSNVLNSVQETIALTENLNPGDYIVATATDFDGNTSEFSDAIEVQAANVIENVAFSEINWAGSSVSENDQWIELYNYGTETQDLTNLVLKGLGNTATPDLTLTNAECTNLNLAPNEYFLISKYDKTDSNTLLNIQSDCVFSDLELNTAGESLILSSNGSDIDTVDFS